MMTSLKELLSSPSEERNVSFYVENRNIWVSKEILTMYSPVFKKMFYGDFKERNQQCYEFPGKFFDDIIELISCLCSYPMQKEIDDKNVTSMIKLADEYDIENLRIRCTTFLKSRLCNQTIESIFRLAETYNMENLKKLCIDFLSENKVDETNIGCMLCLGDELQIDILKGRCADYLIEKCESCYSALDRIAVLKMALKYHHKNAVKDCIRMTAAIIPINEILKQRSQLPYFVISALLEAKVRRSEKENETHDMMQQIVQQNCCRCNTVYIYEKCSKCQITRTKCSCNQIYPEERCKAFHSCGTNFNRYNVCHCGYQFDESWLAEI